MLVEGMFFVSTLYVKDEEIILSRCVGYFEDYEDAKETVEENSCDIYERLYNYAVIEKVMPGLYEYDSNPHWFQISDDGDSYHEINKPEFAKGMIGFGIG